MTVAAINCASTLPRLSIPLRRFGLAFILAALADWFFYDHQLGISLVIFFAVVAAAAIWADIRRVDPRRLPAAAVVAVVGLLPGLNGAGLLPSIFAGVGAAAAVLIATRRFGLPLHAGAARIARLLVIGPFRLLPDGLRLLRQLLRWTRHVDAISRALTWLVPVTVGSVFITLFALANPLIEVWLRQLDFLTTPRIEPARILFWAFAAAFSWAFLRIRLRRGAVSRIFSALRPVGIGVPNAAALFGHTAILRSLVLFNALFAVQTVLDIAFLWSGAELPSGMSYAEYAHRGAYPLIATALLAAAFVLAAMRPGSESERLPTVRALVFLWTGQNVLLVMSSIFRLELYVEVYALTHLRIAAFIWMLLVAFGLVSIVTRIALARSNTWLITANGAALAATLYICSFISFSAIVADFNVAHSQQLTGKGVPIDTCYLCRLGYDAMPAMDRYIMTVEGRGGTVPARLKNCFLDLDDAHRRRMQDWRAWTVSDYRLASWLKDRSDLRPMQWLDDSAALPDPRP